ncbi:hypothetical protein AAVH_07072 [Aphelenchoides avenae]|nr:hypothetical protein AAVH_07072 [Aphelenchus avenae]
MRQGFEAVKLFSYSIPRAVASDDGSRWVKLSAEEIQALQRILEHVSIAENEAPSSGKRTDSGKYGSNVHRPFGFNKSSPFGLWAVANKVTLEGSGQRYRNEPEDVKETYRLASKRSGDIRRDAYNSLPSHLKEVLETSIGARRDRERLQACSKEFREKLALSSEEDKAKWRGVVDFLSNEGYGLWVKGIMPHPRAPKEHVDESDDARDAEER